MKQFRVLVVDDDERILNFLRSKLRACGYSTLTATNGPEALEQLEAQRPDMIVLDLIMPGMSGLDVLKELRSFSTLPVIILSARGADADKIKGLTLGADDYLAKPFNPDELVARIEALRRRTESTSEDEAKKIVRFGDVTIDFQKHTVAVRGEDQSLTRIEWLLLSELARNAGHLMQYGELLSRVWGPEYRDDVQILRTWVSRLRHKLKEEPNSPELIRTMPKAGYIIDQPPLE